MLKAYLDDSGNDGESPVFVVAGLVASAASWAKFSDEWQEALDMEPQLDYFRMTEAFERAWDPVTQDWRDGKFTEKMRLLIRIIEAHAVAAISVSISWSGFRNARKIFGIREASPYPIAFSRIIYDLGKAREELGLIGKIDFIFDKQSDRNAIRRWWPQLYDALNMQTVLSDVVGGEPQFLDDKEVKPLQAADLIAWWIRRRHVEAASGLRSLTPPWGNRLLNISMIKIHWNEQSVLEWFWHARSYSGQIHGRFGGTTF